MIYDLLSCSSRNKSPRPYRTVPARKNEFFHSRPDDPVGRAGGRSGGQSAVSIKRTENQFSRAELYSAEK